MEKKEGQIGNSEELQRWATARKHFSSWARRTVEEVVLPKPRDQEHWWKLKSCKILALPEVPPRQEWEETYFSLPATHAEQSPFQASQWPNSATDPGVWEMQITGISPHPSTQYRAGMGKEKKCIWGQKSPTLTQKEKLCIHSDRSFRPGRKVTGWETGRLYRCFKKLFKGYVLFIAIIKHWPYSLLYIIHLCRLFYS